MIFSDSYRPNSKRSVDEDRAQIVAGFQELVRRGGRVGLRLVNYYKGLPLSYPATPVEINQGVLELDVHQQQAVALSKTRHTFIKCDYFDSPLLAEVHNVDVRRMAAALRNFSFIEILAEHRSALRLELEPQTEVEITGDNMQIAGKLFDLSLGGFSILPGQRCSLGRGVEVSVKVKIPNLLQNTLTPLTVQARHLDTIEGVGAQVCRFSISDDAQCEGVISRYIFQRQVELIRELKELS